MKRLIVLTSIVVMLCGTAISQKMDADKSSSLLSGTWETASAAYDGNEVSIDGMFIPVKMRFDNGKFRMWTEEGEFYGEYSLDTTKKPNWITLLYDAGTEKPFQGSSFRGLFSLEDRILTIVTNVQRRPSKLSAEATSLNSLLILIRERPENEDGDEDN